MVHSVYFDPAVGGDGSTVTDDSSATGLDDYGYSTRLVPAFTQVIAVANFILAQANAAVAAAASALNAPGTNGNSTTSLTIGSGSQSLTIETGKQFSIGQVVVMASKANPSNQMTGSITAYNSATGAMTVNVTQTGGSGTFSDWTVALSALVSNTLPSQTGNNGKFLTTDGTNPSWASVLIASNNLSDLGSVVTARTNLGLGSMATQAAGAVAITGGSIAGITDLAVADGGTGASTAAGARANFGLGALALLGSVDNSNWNGSGTPLAVANGGTGAITAAAGRTNLGLGTAATFDTGTSGAFVPLLNGNNTHSGNLTFAGTVDLTNSAGPSSTTAAGYRGVPVNSKSGNYTSVLNDAARDIYYTATATHSIPANATVAYPIGTAVEISAAAGAVVTINLGGTDTLRWIPSNSTGSRTLTGPGSAVIKKKTATEWWITGVGLS